MTQGLEVVGALCICVRFEQRDQVVMMVDAVGLGRLNQRTENCAGVGPDPDLRMTADTVLLRSGIPAILVEVALDFLALDYRCESQTD